MLESLLLILPVFLILALGVILDVFHILPKETGSVIGAYVLYTALPILLIHILAGSTVADILHGGYWAGVLLSMILVYILGYGLEFVTGRRGHAAAAVTGLSCSCSNVAFIGLPVIMSLMPGNHEALVAAGLATIAPNIVSIPCQVQLEYMKPADGKSSSAIPRLIKAVVLNPLMVGSVVGLVLGFSGLGLWGPLDKAAAMVGNTTAPCMLLALGLDLRGQVRVALSGEQFSLPRLSLVTIIKLVVHPILAWALLSLFGVTGDWLVVGVIMCGTATALVSYVIAQIYNRIPEEAAMAAVTTNVLNLVTLTIIVAALRWQGLM